MSLRQRVEEDIKKAMKARDEVQLSASRLLKAAIVNREIELGKEADDAEVIRLAEKQLKQRREAAEQFRAGGRPELAEKEEKEALCLGAYLPQPLGPEELDALVEAGLTEAGARSPKDMGAAMKVVLAKVQGRADGKTVSELVKKKLAARQST